jgi:hypothetical protein
LPGRSRFITRQQTALDECPPRLAPLDIQLNRFQHKARQVFTFPQNGFNRRA